MLCGHGPNGKGEICPSVRSFAVLVGSGFTITMPPSSGVTPVSGRMLAPCVTTTSVPDSVHPATIARAPAVNSLTRSRNVKALLKAADGNCQGMRGRHPPPSKFLRARQPAL